MSIEYIVLFYHGKNDIHKIRRGLQELDEGRRVYPYKWASVHNKDRTFLVFSTAPESSENVLKEELRSEHILEYVDYENKCYHEGNAKFISIRKTDQTNLFDIFSKEVSLVNRESYENNKTMCVFIGNANPTEAYMVSYFQSSFGYSVFTNNPKDSFMPRHPDPIKLTSSQFKILDYMVDCDESISVAMMVQKKIVPEVESRNQYNNLKKELISYGLITEGKKPAWGPRTGSTKYFIITAKGRYEYFLNGGKKGLAPDELFAQ